MFFLITQPICLTKYKVSVIITVNEKYLSQFSSLLRFCYISMFQTLYSAHTSLLKSEQISMFRNLTCILFDQILHELLTYRTKKSKDLGQICSSAESFC